MAVAAKKIVSSKQVSSNKDKSVIEKIKSRQTEELVIGLCGSVGSGTSTIADKIDEIFSDYGYKPERIKISELIGKHINRVEDELKKDPFLNTEYVGEFDLKKNMKELDSADRIALLQSIGNALRKKESPDILAQLVINEIAIRRSKEDLSEEPSNESEIVQSDIRQSKRKITIVDSLKNPKEIELLRLVYRDMFYLFGVLCPEEIRRTRMVDQKKIDETKATQLMKRDKSEGQKFGQQLLKTILHSEFFITNATENIDSLKPNLKRYVDIMMGDQTITPTIEENAMFHAHSASVKSGCLSKQVGAAIIDKKGNLLSTGCNDVPKAGGGLYSTEDKENDSRCMFKYSGKCINQKEKVDIFEDVEKILKTHLKDKTVSTQILNEIREHKRLKNLIEYCRAIHAEMDAITSVARNGGVSLKGAYLFSTTFPCHNCARHIIATGISKVFYIEPYEKSLALKLHKDSISFDNSVNHVDKKVAFIPFEGVSPNKYLKLFYAEGRKKNGARAKHDPKTAKPAIPMLLDTRYEYESKILENLQKIGILEDAIKLPRES